MDMVARQTKTKLPCPGAGKMPCTNGCPVCHGRGTVRPWTLIIEVDIAPGEARRGLDMLQGLPVGMDIKGWRNNRHRFIVVVNVLRFHLSEAMSVACGYLSGPSVETPLVRKAW